MRGSMLLIQLEAGFDKPDRVSGGSGHDTGSGGGEEMYG
jgi:hypothetical protein